MLVLAKGCIIPGDGQRVWDGCSLGIEQGAIAYLGRDRDPQGAEVIDVGGDYILPGLINNHAHGCTLGPLFASGSPPLPKDQVLVNLDKHLLGGVTTLLNVDGFATMEEVEAVADLHPVQVKTTSSHSPANFKAALAVDGRGLTPVHRQLTMAEMWAKGAVALGEMGSGHTLGGGGQEYMYIPQRMVELTGMTITAQQARQLKEAVLGPYLEVEAFDREQVEKLLNQWRLAKTLNPEAARQLVGQSVLPSLAPAREGIWEGVREARLLRAPIIVHNATATKSLLQELVGEPLHLVAGHSNHDSFSVAEALQHGKLLRDGGAIIDISTFDAFGARETTPTADHFYAFLEAGLADVISTDYGGGKFDPPLVGVAAAVAKGVASLPDMVAKLTAQVAAALPRLAPDRGRLAVGLVADVIVVDRENPALVKMVFCSGKQVVVNGRVVPYYAQ